MLWINATLYKWAHRLLCTHGWGNKKGLLLYIFYMNPSGSFKKSIMVIAQAIKLVPLKSHNHYQCHRREVFTCSTLKKLTKRCCSSSLPALTYRWHHSRRQAGHRRDKFSLFWIFQPAILTKVTSWKEGYFSSTLKTRPDQTDHNDKSQTIYSFSRGFSPQCYRLRIH